MDINYYKEQLEAKEDMMVRTSAFLSQIQESLIEKNNDLSSIQRGISDSINFAKLIQTSLLPDVEILKVFFKDAAYKVVQQIGIGGDTVFIKNTNSGVVFCLLDATGHGIPGAMLSISGSLILNDITSSIEIDNPGVLLKLLNYRLYNTFNTNNYSLAHFEGTAFYYSSKNKTLTYSSAKGKAFLIRSKGEIISLSTNKNSVGEKTSAAFNTSELSIQKGEKLILFSDGLIDQFGGKKDKKFTTSRLKQIVSSNYHKNVVELKEIIYQEHLIWKGKSEQTDDISFMLIEF